MTNEDFKLGVSIELQGLMVSLSVQVSPECLTRLAPGLSPDDRDDCMHEIAAHLAQKMPAWLEPAQQSAFQNLYSSLNEILAERVNRLRS